MDGKYGAALVCRMVDYCNHAARLGVPTSITGFSFNSDPRRPAIYSLARLLREVRVNVREKPSLERFTSLTGTTATLCADVAFLMQPANDSGTGIEQWIHEVRKGGLCPVGVNINAHAFSKLIADRGEEALINDIARELAAAAENCNLAYLLIPHDTKPMAGDIRLLSSLEQALNRAGGRAVRSVSLTDPARIKHVVGLLDLVITGRMHLAIAAIGMVTPVLCITYQDKFEGLFEHLGLPPECMIRPDECTKDDLSKSIFNAMKSAVLMRAKINSILPVVVQLSKLNTGEM
jgi:polysaccharide pyruvyl transferase WcaK-like protein